MKKLLLLLLAPLFLCVMLPQRSVAQTGGDGDGGIILIPLGPGGGGGIGGGTGGTGTGGTGTGGTGTGGTGGGGTGGGIGGGNQGDPILPGIDPNPFSLTEPIEAWADLDMGQVVVVFNQDFGSVTVGIVDAMGRTVCSAVCDTDVQAEVWLPLPASGHYTLRVANGSGEACGPFDI